MESQESLKKIVKGTGIILLGIFLSKILTFLYRVIIARMGAEQYGLFSLSLAILGTFSIFAILGLDTGLVRYVSYYRGKQDLARIKGIFYFILKIAIFTSIIFTILLFFFSDLISNFFFHNPDLSLILKIMAFAVPSAVLSTIFLSLIRSYQNAKYEVYSKAIFENISKIILTLIFIILGFKILGIILAYVLAIFGTAVISFYFVKKTILPQIKNIKSIPPDKKELISYSLPLVFNQFIFLIILWMDTFMIAFFLDAKATGIYNVVIPVAMLMQSFPYALRYIFLPMLTELHSQNNKSTFISIYKASTKWIFTINLMIFSLFLLLSKEFISFFFGNEYIIDTLFLFNKDIPISIISLIIISTGFLVSFTMTCSREILVIFKKTKFIAFNTLIAAILNIFLNLHLIPIFGIVGAAIATSISFIVRSILIAIEAYLITKINVFRFNYIKVFFSAILSFIVVFIFKLLFPLTTILSLIINTTIFMTLYFLLLIITKSLEKEDLFIIETIKKKIFKSS